MNRNNSQALPVALVTGAARRIGAAIIMQLHQANYNVIIHCNHSLQKATQLAHQCNAIRTNSALVLQQNLQQIDGLSQLIEDSVRWHGRLDVLINNASVFIRNHFDKFDASLWERQFNINVRAPFVLSQLALPYLQKEFGNIINLIDIHAESPIKDYAIYCQTKAALAAQTKALAKEFAPHVRVNGISPGAIAWPEQENALDEKVQQHIIDQTPLKTHGKPEYIAQAVVALLLNPFITGEILAVDGGRSI